VESRLKKVEEEITTIKTQIEPIMKLVSQMTIGFCSLDNRMTILHEMLLQDRIDRLARQKEKRDAAEKSQTTTNRSAGSGTQTTLQNKKPTETSKKNNQDMTKPLKIIQWNARGLYRSRLEEFKNQLRYHNPHIVLLSETHWKDEYKVKFSAYNSFNLNRASQGGGVAILVKKNIQATLLDFPPHENIEAVGATIRLSNKDIIEVASVYCPNGNRCNYEEIENILTHTGRSAIVGGDLNAHSDLWEDGYPTNASGRNLKQYLQNENKFILATPKSLGTRPSLTDNRNSTIDLTLCTPDLAKNTTIVTGPYWGSDHLPVVIELQINITTNTQAPLMWKFHDSKWQEWNEDLTNHLDL